MCEWIKTKDQLPTKRGWCLGIFQEPDGWINPIHFVCDYVGKVKQITTNEGWILKECTDCCYPFYYYMDRIIGYYRNLKCVAWTRLPEIPDVSDFK